MSSYRESLESFLKTLDIEVSRVLDIGGGANPIIKRVRSFRVQEYKVLDNQSEDMVWIPDYEWDINFEIPIEEKKKIGRFDLIFCLEVFEYIFDPIVALSNISYFLKDNAHAYISFPTLYPLHNPEGIDMLRYQKDGINELMNQCNLSVEEVIQRMPTSYGLELLKQFYASEGFHARRYTNDIYALGYICRIRK